MRGELQRDIEVVDSLIRGVWGAESYELEAWQRIRARLTPSRERVAGAIGGAIKDHFSDKPWTEVRLIAADAAIAAMGETP